MWVWQKCQQIEAKLKKKDHLEIKGERVITFHAPYVKAYNCTGPGPDGIQTVRPCTAMEPLPDQVTKSDVPYCAVPKPGYHTHYMYFAHAVLISPWLRKV